MATVGLDVIRLLWQDGPRLLGNQVPRMLSLHSGPVATLGASVLVALSYRWARKIARVLMEVVLCGAVLGALTHFGVLRW
ncbi:MAG: hypothetical protein U0174_24290 [Polyangiaceae bacterium]